MIDLDVALAEYRSGQASREELVSQAIEYVRALLAGRFRLPFDAQCEVLSEMFPAIDKAVTDYRDVGSSLAVFLLVHTRYAAIRRKRLWAQRFARETPVPFGCDDEQAIPVVDDDLDCPSERCRRPTLSNTRQRDTVRRYLLISFCRNLPILDSSQVEFYSRMFDLPDSWVNAALQYCSDCRSHTHERAELYRRRRDHHYATMIDLQRGMVGASDSERARLEHKYSFHRRRWQFYIDRLKKQLVHLSHREVATLLGIPKGSVDSAMANLTQRVATVAECR